MDRGFRARALLTGVVLATMLAHAAPGRGATVLRLTPEWRGEPELLDEAAREQLGFPHVTLRLSRDRIVVSSGPGAVALDLGNGNICWHDGYSVPRGVSLHANVAHRVWGMEERSYYDRPLGTLEDVFTRTLREDPMFAEETELSIRSPNETPKLRELESDSMIRFAGEKRAWCAHGRDEIEVPRGAPDLFALYMRHFQGGHPDFLDHLARLSFIPSWLSYRVDSMEQGELRIHVTRLSDDTPLPEFDCDGPLLELPEPAHRVMAFASNLDPQSRKEYLERLEEEGRREFEAGRIFQGFLCALEYQMADSGEKPGWMDDWRDEIEEEPLTHQVTELIESYSNPGNLERKLAAYEELRPKVGERGYLVDTWVGSLRLVSGRVDLAVGLFASAIEANPQLVEAWLGLADVYRKHWDTYHAWVCMQAARGFAPDDSRVEGFTEFEKELEEDFPEFFEP